MSAPVLDPPTMPTMVSRLPKFGLRTKPATPSNDALATATANTRLTNGFYHHPGPAGVSGGFTGPPSSVKQNGFIRVPVSFSMKWRKDNETPEDGTVDGELRRGKGGSVGTNRTQQWSPVTSQRDAKKPATSAGKGRGFGYPATSSSSPSPPQSSPRTLPVSKSGSKTNQTAFRLNGTRQTLNGLNGSKPWTGTNGSLRQPHSFAFYGGSRPGSRPGSGPGSRSGSPLQKKAQASRSHSSDSLGSAPSTQLTESDRYRSRSLIQVRQQPSPTLPHSTSSLPRNSTARSFSTNRSAGRGFKEPTASSAKAPPRGTLTASPVRSRTPEGGGRGGVKVQSSVAPGRSGFSIPSLLPPSALKKPLLSSLGPASKHSGISYKLSRPSLNKQPRPLRVTPAGVSERDPDVKRGLTVRRNSVETPSTTENSPERTPESPETEGLIAKSQGEVSIVGETLEDMSLSSSSSLDRNDTSQEYMDDFDNLGNGGVNILLLSKNDEDDSGLDQSCTRFDEEKVAVNGVTKAAGLCFLDDGMDWTSMRLGGERGEHRLTRLPHRRRSSQPDYHDQGGSSLDLSPSDSCGSGGTYMWDEEGLEPLGGTATTATDSNATHHIGSFDSDINSIDILTNLDCDLDDDDLMLDADVCSEDASLHSDGDGISHMAQWRKRQLCWGTQDVHNDNESDFQCYKLTEDAGNKRIDSTRDTDLILELYPPRSTCLSPGSPGLGIDVEELADDCSAVRSQLEYLHRLLLQEDDADDDTLTTDTLSPEASGSNTQVQALLQEVQQLREELRSRDQTIAQLTLKLTAPTATTRCCCQETTGRTDRHTQTSVAERESVASQTPWTEHVSQILHSASHELQEPLRGRCLAPPPANPCSTHPDARADCPDATDPEGGNDGWKRVRKEEEKGETRERRGTRSLQPPQPSKLRLFLPQTSAATSQKRAAKQHDLESASGVKVKMAAVTSGSSRLPKPKSH